MLDFSNILYYSCSEIRTRKFICRSKLKKQKEYYYSTVQLRYMVNKLYVCLFSFILPMWSLRLAWLTVHMIIWAVLNWCSLNLEGRTEIEFQIYNRMSTFNCIAVWELRSLKKNPVTFNFTYASENFSIIAPQQILLPAFQLMLFILLVDTAKNILQTSFNGLKLDVVYKYSCSCL